tara:strand:- start:420 stop:920 length:501 start_codon:yes stop_codon:yes gene_type:complete
MINQHDMPPRAFTDHDHGLCAQAALASARNLCARRSLKLTPARETVLNILLESHAALGAYTILEKLARAGFRAQPPVAYRALDFLVENGFAHRIEKLNAFVACSRPEQGHDPAFMICSHCRLVAETSTTPGRGVLGRTAQAIGFEIERTVVEVEGICAGCLDMGPA